MLKNSLIMSYLPVRIMFLSLKTVKNSNGQMHWVHVYMLQFCMTKGWFPVLYIDLLFSEESRLVD